MVRGRRCGARDPAIQRHALHAPSGACTPRRRGVGDSPASALRTLRVRRRKERVCDTLELEVRYMRRAFGPLWSLLLKRAGLTGIERREDMTRLVESMLALGL